MKIYLLIVLGLSSFLGVIVPTERGAKGRLWYCVIMFSLLFGFSGLRGINVGIDTFHRYSNFYTIANTTLRSFPAVIPLVDKEIGYQILLFVITRVFKDPIYAEMIYSAFIIGVHLWFLNHYSKHLSLSVAMFIVFVFSASMNTTRQYIAISFFLIALHNIINGKIKPAIVFLLLGTSFHISTLICFVLLFLAFPSVIVRKTTFIKMIPICIAITLLYQIILKLVFIILPQYEHYLEFTFYTESTDIPILWICLYILITALIVLHYPTFYNPKEVDISLYHEKFRRESIIAIVFLAFASFDLMSISFQALYRIMRFFHVGFLIEVPEQSLWIFKDSFVNKLVLYSLFTVLIVGLGIFEFNANKYNIFPYHFFWA